MSLTQLGKIVAILLVILILALFGLSAQFNADIAQQIGVLEAIAQDSPTASQPFAEDGEARLQALPPLVQDYLGRSLPAPHAPAALIHVEQGGSIRLNPDSDWMPFTADEYFAIRQPGFVWTAKINAHSPLRMSVLDSYVRGEGQLEGRLLDAVPLVKAEGESTSKGELMRYLAELVWCPDAMLHNDALQWKSVDDQTVEVSVEQKSEKATVLFHFDESGDIQRVSALDRPRQVGGESLDTRWVGRFSNYQNVGGYRIPTEGEVSWDLEDQTFIYWRGKITALSLIQ